MNYFTGIYLVARREYLAYVGAPGFWISLITTPLLLLTMIFLPIALRQAEPTRYITVISDVPEEGAALRDAFDAEARASARGEVWSYAQRAAPKAGAGALTAFDAERDPGEAIAAARAALDKVSPGAGARFKATPPRYEVVLAPAPDIEALKPYLTGQRAIGQGMLAGAFVLHGTGTDVKFDYWSTNLTDTAPVMRAREVLADRMRGAALRARGLDAGEAERIENLTPQYSQIDPRPATGAVVTSRDRAPFVVATGLSILLWSSIVGVANMLLTGVLEEKSNKILDALMTSVTPLQILAGKLTGVALVSVTLFTMWGLFGLLALTQAAHTMEGGFVGALALAALSPSLLATFLICFAAGYLMYGAIFLGIGSLCDSLQEAQTLLGPLFLVMVTPLLLLGPAFENPNSPLVTGASWIPPFTPFVMMMRAPSGLSFADTIGPIIVLLVTLILVLIVAARVFRAGVSHQLRVSDLFSWRRALRGADAP